MKQQHQQRRSFAARSGNDSTGTTSPLGSPDMEHIELNTLGVHSPRDSELQEPAKSPLSGIGSET
ncbi:hypothetical protein GGI21_006698, partial [Coemansia aciculifera]